MTAIKTHAPAVAIHRPTALPSFSPPSLQKKIRAAAAAIEMELPSGTVDLPESQYQDVL